MTVVNGSAELEDNREVSGVKIVSVQPGSAAAIAGVRGGHSGLASAMTAGFFVAGMVFPPAMLGAVLVQGSGLGESHDLIIAVDGQRTRNTQEFSNALAEATPGELVYVVLLRSGRRNNMILTAH